MNGTAGWSLNAGTWHERVSDQIQVKILGTKTIDSGKTSEWDGAYLVQLVDRSPSLCSWSGDLSADEVWQQLDVEITPVEDAGLHVRVCFLGENSGPCWCGVFSHLSSITVLEWSLGETREIQGVIWPRQIDIRPLAGLALPHAFFLSHDAAINNLESVVAEDDPPPPVPL